MSTTGKTFGIADCKTVETAKLSTSYLDSILSWILRRLFVSVKIFYYRQKNEPKFLCFFFFLCLGLGISLINRKVERASDSGCGCSLQNQFYYAEQINLCCKNAWTKLFGYQWYSSISVKKMLFLESLTLNLKFWNTLKVCCVYCPTFVYFLL